MTQTSHNVYPLGIADGAAAIRHVFVRDLTLDASIGVHPHEQDRMQRVRVNLDLAVRESRHIGDDLVNVVCYERIVSGVRALVGAGHVKLVETLAERIAAMCFDDGRVKSVRVRVEKLDVFHDATSVGVEIERFNPQG